MTRQDDLFNSAQFCKTYRLNIHRQLNTVQLRNKRKKCNRERVGIIQMAKANLVDDPYNIIQLQTELEKDFFKTISSSARITIKHIEFFRVLRNILRELELVIFVGKNSKGEDQ